MPPPRHPDPRTVAEPPAVELRPVDADLYRALLRRQAATVTVVTAAGLPAGRRGPALPPTGFTATSFTAVSLVPPLVSFCLGTAASSWPTVARAEHVAVHLLAADQQEIARTFATSGVDRLAAYPDWSSGPFGLPLLGGAVAWLVCRIAHRVPAGDHAVVIAEPLALGAGRDEDPLVYHRGGYTSVGHPRTATG